MDIVLASGLDRRDLIQRLKLGVRAESSPYDEEAAKESLGELAPGALAAALARGKAEALAQRWPEALIVRSAGWPCWTEIIGKPGTPEAARGQLEKLQGRESRAFDGVLRAAGELGEM